MSQPPTAYVPVKTTHDAEFFLKQQPSGQPDTD